MGCNVALKKLSVGRKKLDEKGGSVEGYLLKKDIPMISYQKGTPNPVPKLILVGTDGVTFSVLLGSAAIDDLPLLQEHLWTKVTKLPKAEGEDYHLYELEQDELRKLPGIA